MAIIRSNHMHSTGIITLAIDKSLTDKESVRTFKNWYFEFKYYNIFFRYLRAAPMKPLAHGSVLQKANFRSIYRTVRVIAKAQLQFMYVFEFVVYFNAKVTDTFLG
jgi:hypothetical protein